MSQYLDQAFQKITDRPCADCIHFMPTVKLETDRIIYLNDRCTHKSAMEPLTGINLFAFAMRNSESLCGLKGTLWQAE